MSAAAADSSHGHALPAWLDPSARTLKRVAVALVLLWGGSGLLGSLIPADSLLRSPWLQYPLLLAWLGLAAYLAVMAWHALWRGQRPGLMLVWIALAWLSVLLHVFLGLSGISALDKTVDLFDLAHAPVPVQDLQAGALHADLPAERREMAARLLYQSTGVRVAWRNAKDEVQAFVPSAKDEEDWRSMQEMTKTQRQMTQQFREMRADIGWTLGLVIAAFGVMQLLLALALVWVLRREHAASARCEVR